MSLKLIYKPFLFQNRKILILKVKIGGLIFLPVVLSLPPRMFVYVIVRSCPQYYHLLHPGILRDKTIDYNLL